VSLSDAADENDDHAVAAWLAQSAGQLLLELRRGSRSGPALGAEGDRQSNELLLRALAALRPGDAVLSEEAADDPTRLTARRVWIIDPLDGTREYGEDARTDWAVHVALWEDGTLAAGTVALPAQGRLLRDDRPPTLSDVRLHVPPRLVVSRSRPPAVAGPVAEALGASIVPMGSAGAKTAAVVLGEAEAYVHAGGQYEWDSAAPVAVAAAAGLHVSRLDGSPLRYNRPDVALPDLVICRPELATAILAAAGGFADAH
jgi:3'(2'), 5'-bisphosphate nucleotidase